MKHVGRLGVILAVSFAGEALHALLPLPIPAGVYGLCLMLLLFCAHVVKPDFLRPTAEGLIAIMPLLFIPATVGLIDAWDALSPVLLPFALCVTVVTAVVMAVTGMVVESMEKRRKP